MSQFFATGISALGPTFIGRAELLDKAVKYLYEDKKNVSLVGLPMVGKTSVAIETFERIKQRSNSDGRLTLLVETNLA